MVRDAVRTDNIDIESINSMTLSADMPGYCLLTLISKVMCHAMLHVSSLTSG